MVKSQIVDLNLLSVVKLHVILAQSEGGPEIDMIAGGVVARETFNILTTTAVIRPNTIINLFLGRTNPQHADWLNAILPRVYVMNNNISADSLRAQNNVDIQPLCSEDFPEIDIQPLCSEDFPEMDIQPLCSEDFPEKDIQPLCSEDFNEMDILPLCLVKYDMKKTFSGHRAIVL